MIINTVLFYFSVPKSSLQRDCELGILSQGGHQLDDVHRLRSRVVRIGRSGGGRRTTSATTTRRC